MKKQINNNQAKNMKTAQENTQKDKVETPKPKLLVVANNPKVAEALKAKAPEFKDAEVTDSWDDDVLRGNHVLTTQLPATKAQLCETYIQAGLSMRKEEIEAASAFDILAKMFNPIVIETKTSYYRDWAKATLVEGSPKQEVMEQEEFSDTK